MYRYQKVWVLITENENNNWPVVYIASGIIKRVESNSRYYSKKYYCEIEAAFPIWWGRTVVRKQKQIIPVLKSKVLPKNKKNYKTLQQKAKKFIELAIREKEKEIQKIERKYSRLLKIK